MLCGRSKEKQEMVLSERRKVWKWCTDKNGTDKWLRSHVRFCRAGDRIKTIFEETGKEVVLCVLNNPEKRSDGKYIIKIARY